MSEKEIIKHPATKEEFNELISGNKPVLVDFFATWCGPCKMMEPILDDMVKNYKNINKIEIVKANTDVLREVALDFGVMSLPTFMFFKDGKPVEKYIGMRSQADLEDKLNELVN